MTSWKMTAFASKSVIEAALLAQEARPDWDEEIVLAGFEISEDKPDDWRLDAYTPREPAPADREAVFSLFESDVPDFQIEQLPDADWVTESQKGVEPILAGKFHVHTPDFQPSADPDVRSFVIPASQAFGTGRHETTAGCLAMLTRMKAEGVNANNVADIGTGTGLLAFAAMDLWPDAQALASDIDPVCAEVVEFNAEQNGIGIGDGPKEMALVVAPGVDHPDIQSRAPFDLLIANILAAPLIELAPDFMMAVESGGSIVLAGLLETQERAVVEAYRDAGAETVSRIVNGDWSILWLRRPVSG